MALFMKRDKYVSACVKARAERPVIDLTDEMEINVRRNREEALKKLKLKRDKSFVFPPENKGTAVAVASASSAAASWEPPKKRFRMQLDESETEEDGCDSDCSSDST